MTLDLKILFVGHAKSNQTFIPKFMHENIHDNIVYNNKKK